MSGSSLAIDSSTKTVSEIIPSSGVDSPPSTVKEDTSIEKKTHNFAMRALKGIARFFKKLLKISVSEEEKEVRSLKKDFEKRRGLHKSQRLILFNEIENVIPQIFQESQPLSSQIGCPSTEDQPMRLDRFKQSIGLFGPVGGSLVLDSDQGGVFEIVVSKKNEGRKPIGLLG